MCLEILRNPVSAVVKAKKKNLNKTLIILVEACVFFALSVGALTLRGGNISQTTGMLALGAMVGVFAMIFAMSILVGYMLKIIAPIMGGRGGYYEGLTTVAYSLTPVSLGVLAATLLALLPGGLFLSVIAMAIGLSYGLSLVYRAVKELFSMDMVSTMIVVSILFLVIIISFSVSSGLSAIANLGTISVG